MTKPRLIYRHGTWLCVRFSVCGRGLTMREAWDDMWARYRDVADPRRPSMFYGQKLAA